MTWPSTVYSRAIVRDARCTIKQENIPPRCTALACPLRASVGMGVGLADCEYSTSYRLSSTEFEGLTDTGTKYGLLGRDPTTAR